MCRVGLEPDVTKIMYDIFNVSTDMMMFAGLQNHFKSLLNFTANVVCYI